MTRQSRTGTVIIAEDGEQQARARARVMGHRRDTLNSACQSESTGLSRSGLRKYDPAFSAVLRSLCQIIHGDNTAEGIYKKKEGKNKRRGIT